MRSFERDKSNQEVEQKIRTSRFPINGVCGSILKKLEFLPPERLKNVVKLVFHAPFNATDYKHSRWCQNRNDFGSYV